ncbi:rod-binding protein [Allosphingosinicella flava]|uniref:Rod-binding protein n=1 Tax=Allosphingosinicella flava TaxID=2771430 RepID=A0A7T2LMA3_9SPHN|nr:rod-binding protein [Sphingosinicella flava]QPQ55331.1 rod-binding protein [Sphingosinicella flava]
MKTGGITTAVQPQALAKAADIKAAAKAFEAVFLRQMIGSMRQANLGEDILGNRATDQFRELSDAKLADNMAETGGFGIAEMLLKQFGASGGTK